MFQIETPHTQLFNASSTFRKELVALAVEDFKCGPFYNLKIRKTSDLLRRWIILFTVLISHCTQLKVAHKIYKMVRKHAWFLSSDHWKPYTITLLEHPEYKHEISAKACELSNLLADMIGSEENAELPVDTVNPQIMDKVLQFMEHHAENPPEPIPRPIKTNVIGDIVSEWDASFINLGDDQDSLMDLILAANYLDCRSLLELGILKIATMVKDKNAEEVKTIFHIEKDITEEEETQVRDATEWMFNSEKKDKE